MPMRSKGLMIHHWDTDGVCSAALLLRHRYRGYVNWTPTIGAFYLSSEQVSYARRFDDVVIVDMALPEGDVEALSQECSVTVYDHHHQDPLRGVEHINPVAHGSNQDNFPSCTWVVKKSLGLPVTLPVVLGLVGDREQKLRESPVFWDLVQGYAAENSLTFDELHGMVQLIDSCYKVGDREAVMEAPRLLVEGYGPDAITGNVAWRRNMEDFDEELKRILEAPPVDREGVLYVELDTGFSIISTVTRRIAWGTGRDTVVVNRGFFEDEDQLYCRSSRLDMQPMIDRARVKGFNAGGKKDVLGAIVPKNETAAFVDELIKYLKK
jgi:hypothetical protein